METKKQTNGGQRVVRTADGRFAVVQVAANGAEQLVAGPWRDRRDALAMIDVYAPREWPKPKPNQT